MHSKNVPNKLETINLATASSIFWTTLKQIDIPIPQKFTFLFEEI